MDHKRKKIYVSVQREQSIERGANLSSFAIVIWAPQILLEVVCSHLSLKMLALPLRGTVVELGLEQAVEVVTGGTLPTLWACLLFCTWAT